MSPRQLGMLLRSADDGNTGAMVTLAEEIEERDPHFRSVIFTRKAVISQLRPEVEPASDEPRDLEIAEAVTALLTSPAAPGLFFDLLDAVSKGWSAVETIWTMGIERWEPARYEWLEPRHTVWDRESLSELRLRDGTPGGAKLWMDKWIVHTSKTKSGLPLRGGLARAAFAAFVAKAYTVGDLARFLEGYGMPLRLGKVGAALSQEDRDELLNSLRRLGSDGAAVIGPDEDVQFVEVDTGRGAEAFLGTARYWDDQVSKLVLGQAGTTDGNSGNYRQAEAYMGVRLDYARHDATHLAASTQRDLVAPFVRFNWGKAKVPRLQLPVPLPRDLSKITAAIAPLVDRGLPISHRQMYELLGMSAPAKGEPLMGPAATDAEGPSGDTPGETEPRSEPDDDPME